MKTKLYLLINTVNPDYASFAIFSGKGVILYLLGFVDKQERLNKELNTFFKKNKIKSEDIGGVMVISGPGSFSSSRAGIVLANSFNFLYGAPVLGVKDTGAGLDSLIRDNFPKLKCASKNAIAEVYYQKLPNITYASIAGKKT